jgi:hypothetical protein
MGNGISSWTKFFVHEASVSGHKELVLFVNPNYSPLHK